MGLFSSKKVHTVSTTVSRVLQDNLLPNARKSGAIQALFAQDDQMVEHILEEQIGSIGVKAERMYQYGKDTYLYGVPQSTLFSNQEGKDTVKSVLSGLVGQEVEIEYYHFGALNNLHYAWKTLVDSYGYIPATNEIKSLSNSRGFPVYLDDIEVTVAQATTEEVEKNTLTVWGTPPNAGYTPRRRVPITPGVYNLAPAPAFVVDRSSETDYFRITYVWSTDPAGIKKVIEFWLILPMSLEDPDLDYFQVKYSYTPPGQTYPTIRYWTYQSGLGTFPVLDALFQTTGTPFGSFFPLGYFRYNKLPTSDDITSTEYKQSKKLLKYLGMDYADVRDAVQENPDINDVESAFLMLGVPAKTTNPTEQRYLFEFFKQLYQKTGNIIFEQSSIFELLQNTVNYKSPSEASVVIQDARFKMAVKMDGLYRHLRVGVVGAKGTYSSIYELRKVDVVTTQYENSDDEVGIPVTVQLKQPCFLYRHQVTDNIYEEIEVIGLGTKYFVWGKYADLATQEEGALLIPLDHDLTEHYAASDRETLYARSLHYVFNAHIVTKLSWYQQDWFQMVIVIVAVFVSAITWNPAPLMAAIAVGGIVLINFIIVMLAEMMIMQMLLKLFVKAVGAQFAMVVAVIATLYGMGSGLMDGGVQGAPWAEELLQLGNGLTKTIQESMQQEVIGLQEDYQELVTQQSTLLENAEKLLEHQTLLSPFLVFGESCSDYFNRTAHSGNIGVLGLDAITNYCDVALTLPKLSQTLGDSFTSEAFAFNNLG